VIQQRFMERIAGVPENELADLQQAIRLLQAKVFY
jgi:hypothetical protein